MLHLRELTCGSYLASLILMVFIAVFSKSAVFAQDNNGTLQSEIPNISVPSSDNQNQEVHVSEKDRALKAWVDDIVLIAKDPKSAIGEPVFEEDQLDDQTRDRMWVFVDGPGLKNEIGRFSGKPITNEDIQTLRPLYLSALDGNAEAVLALEVYSNSNDAVMGFYAANALAVYFLLQDDQDKFIDAVNQMVDFEFRVPEDMKDEYKIILSARLQEKAVYTNDPLLILETTRNSMVERYRLGLGQISASNLYNVFRTLFTFDRLNEAESIIEAMKVLTIRSNVEDLFSVRLAEAVLGAESGEHKQNAQIFDQIVPLAQATEYPAWADVIYAYAAREYALAGDFETARARQEMVKTFPESQLPFADLVNFEEAFAKGDLKAAETFARKLIDLEKDKVRQTSLPGSWLRYKTHLNDAKRKEAILTELSALTAREQDIKADLSSWKWFTALMVVLLVGVGLAVLTLIRRASSNLKHVKNFESQTNMMQDQLRAEAQKNIALSKLIESVAEEISTRLAASLTLIEFATRSSDGADMPFANEAKAALRSFSVLSLDMAAISGGRLPKPNFETIESQGIDDLLRKRLRDHMDGDASCDIKVNLSEDVPATISMDCDRVLHIVMCLVAGAWKRSSPSPVQIDFGFDRSRGFLKVDVIDIGGIVPANIEDHFSTLPSESSVDNQQMLLRLQYAAAEKLAEAMGGAIEFNGSHKSSSGLGLKASVSMPVVRQTSEEGAPSYIVTAPG